MPTDRQMHGHKDVEGQRDRPAGQAGWHTSRQACRQTDRQPFNQENNWIVDSRAASAHLAMGVSQLLMQHPIAVLQLLHLPLQGLPCTLYCCQFDLGLTPRLLQLLLGLLAHLCQLSRCRCLQVCKAISTSLALLLPAHPQASTHAQ